jgi:methylenetetrahydrofolate reductase (NADPH)
MSEESPQAIAALLKRGHTTSVECFPPKTPAGLEQLHRCLDELTPANLDFMSITYGAGGSTRDLTRDLVVQTNAQHSYPVMPHLTCIGHTREELTELLDDYRANGVVNVLALAGDPPADGSPAEGDFEYASQLIELVRSTNDMSIGVAVFPEGHPRSATLAEDRRYVAEKLAAADFGISNMFFRPELYFRMVEDLAALGCDSPILPGITIMSNPETIRRFAAMNGAWFPEDLAAEIDALDGDDRSKRVVDAVTEMSAALVEGGAPGLHFYALNRSEIVLQVLANLS